MRVWQKAREVLICGSFMKGIKKIYTDFQLASAVCMILALLWLTVSAPFVYATQKSLEKELVSQTGSNNAASEEECPVNNSEEKTPGNANTFSEEYLHEHHVEESFFSLAAQFHKCENADDYRAYHGEVQVPPPNA